MQSLVFQEFLNLYTEFRPDSWLGGLAETERCGTCHGMCKGERWGPTEGLTLKLSPVFPTSILWLCRTCILAVPPSRNSENTKNVPILRSNFVFLTGVSMVSDNFTLWEAKGELVNMQVVLFWRVTKLSSVDVGYSEISVQGRWPQRARLRMIITDLVKRCTKVFFSPA